MEVQKSNNIYDDFIAAISGVVGVVQTGVTSYYDTQTAKYQAKANTALARTNADGLNTINELSSGNGAYNWSDPNAQLAGVSTSTILIGGAALLAVFAIARA